MDDAAGLTTTVLYKSLPTDQQFWGTLQNTFFRPYSVKDQKTLSLKAR